MTSINHRQVHLWRQRSTNHRQGHIWLQPITGKSSRMSSTNHGQAHKWLQPITVSQSSSHVTDQSQARSHMTSTNHRQGTAISLHMYSSTGTRIDRGNYYLLPVPYVFHENFHFSCKQSCGTESLLTGSDVSIVYSFWNVKILTDVKNRLKMLLINLKTIFSILKHSWKPFKNF